jgi:outer membrane immunogenic protein
MKKSIGIAIALLIGTPAFAADMAIKAPRMAAAPAYNWSGFYIGVNGGYGWGDDPVALSGPPTGLFFSGAAAGVFPTSLAAQPNGGVLGGQAGWNYQSGMTVFGLEGDIDWSGIKRTDTFVSPGPVTPPIGVPRTVMASQSLDWLATFRARLGWTPTDHWLLFVTGGGAVGGASVTASLTTNDLGGTPGCVVGTCATGSSGSTLTGWSGGFGGEVAVGGNWSVRAEYLHYDLGSISVTGIDARFLPLGSNAVTGMAHVRGEIVRGAVNFKLN